LTNNTITIIIIRDFKHKDIVMKYNGVIQRKFTLLDKHLLELQKHLKDVNFSVFKNDWALRGYGRNCY
jgi:hypothetical protein